MSTQADPKELLQKVEDNDLRKQLADVYESLSGSTLRRQVEDLTEQVKTYKATERTRAFKDAGFDPESGPGKALAKLYDGEPDPAAIRQFASEEFGFEPNGTSQEQGQQVDPSQARASGEDRLGQLNAGTIPARDPSIDDQINEAQANGDWSTYDRLQAQKIELLRQG